MRASPGQIASLWVSRPGLGTTQMGREWPVGERGLLWHLLSQVRGQVVTTESEPPVLFSKNILGPGEGHTWQKRIERTAASTACV